MFATHNGNPLQRNGNYLMFDNYMIHKYLVEYESCDQMAWNYFDGYQWIQHILTNMKTTRTSWPYYYVCDGGIKNNKLSNFKDTNDHAWYYYNDTSTPEILNTLQGNSDWSISIWIKKDLDRHWQPMGALYPEETYWDENEQYVLTLGNQSNTGFNLKIIPDDASHWYTISDVRQKYPMITEYYNKRIQTSTLRFTIEGNDNDLTIPNCYDPSTGNFQDYSSEGRDNFFHVAIRKKDFYIEVIRNADFENSLKISLTNNSFPVSTKELRILSYGDYCYIDELFIFKKYLSNQEVRRLRMIRNIF